MARQGPHQRVYRSAHERMQAMERARVPTEKEEMKERNDVKEKLDARITAWVDGLKRRRTPQHLQYVHGGDPNVIPLLKSGSRFIPRLSFCDGWLYYVPFHQERLERINIDTHVVERLFAMGSSYQCLDVCCDYAAIGTEKGEIYVMNLAFRDRPIQTIKCGNRVSSVAFFKEKKRDETRLLVCTHQLIVYSPDLLKEIASCSVSSAGACTHASHCRENEFICMIEDSKTILFVRVEDNAINVTRSVDLSSIISTSRVFPAVSPCGHFVAFSGALGSPEFLIDVSTSSPTVIIQKSSTVSSQIAPAVYFSPHGLCVFVHANGTCSIMRPKTPEKVQEIAVTETITTSGSPLNQTIGGVSFDRNTGDMFMEASGILLHYKSLGVPSLVQHCLCAIRQHADLRAKALIVLPEDLWGYLSNRIPQQTLTRHFNSLLNVAEALWAAHNKPRFAPLYSPEEREKRIASAVMSCPK